MQLCPRDRPRPLKQLPELHRQSHIEGLELQLAAHGGHLRIQLLADDLEPRSSSDTETVILAGVLAPALIQPSDFVRSAVQVPPFRTRDLEQDHRGERQLRQLRIFSLSFSGKLFLEDRLGSHLGHGRSWVGAFCASGRASAYRRRRKPYGLARRAGKRFIRGGMPRPGGIVSSLHPCGSASGKFSSS